MKERFNFDPWGRRRNPSDWSYKNVSSTTFFDRGFTGHEHLDQLGLINMNGRVYDPLTAMFLSPDIYLQSPESSQGFNRYTYCLNNPLIYVDPSGNNYLQYMQNHWDQFDYRGGVYSEGSYYQPTLGGGGYVSATNVSYDALHPHDLWSVGPGQGLNGSGANGSYYDYYTGQYRSTLTQETVNWVDVYDNAISPYSSAFVDLEALRQYEREQWDKGLTASLGEEGDPHYWLAKAGGFAVTTSSVDGPLLFGEAVGLAALTLASLHDAAVVTKKYLDKQGVQYVLLKSNGDIWKIGQTTQYDFLTERQFRYSVKQLDRWGVTFIKEYSGSRLEIMMVEKMKLWNYIHIHNTLPPGNFVPW